MPTSIPYHPSLVLANVVPNDTLERMKEISGLQSPIDNAETELNSAIMTMESLQMSTAELATLSIETSSLTGATLAAQTAVLSAAQNLALTRIKNAPAIAACSNGLSAVTESIESPVDYNKTAIKKMPIGFDSLKFNAQYFSFDEMDQEASNSMNSIKGFISSSVKVLGDSYAGEVTHTSQQQIATNRENHDVEGTLIITATCTHQDARLLAPFVLDVDKGIRVWNEYFSTGLSGDNTAGGKSGQFINMNDSANVAKIAQQQDSTSAATMNILSGCSMGSSFVGMVHVLRQEGTSSTQTMNSVASSLQGQMEVGAWWAKMKGGFGVDSQFANDAKKLLSTQNIQSHVSMVVMGVIPSIKSNEIQIGVKQFSNFDPAEMMDKLATLSNATASDQTSVQESAAQARTGGQMVQLRASEIQSVMTGLGAVDDGKNSMLDINSLMTSMEDYINKAIGGDVGVPLSYYLKPITASQLAQMWVSKYLPGEYVTSAGDDLDPNNPKPPGGDK